MHVYIAAPLFSHAEREFNLDLKEFVEAQGFTTYLPQFDGGLLADLLNSGIELQEAKSILFHRDLDAIQSSQIILFLLDGRVPDEGGCIEIGIGFALGKECIGFKTDYRSFIAGTDNLMITGVLKGRIASTFDELQMLLLETRRQVV